MSQYFFSFLNIHISQKHIWLIRDTFLYFSDYFIVELMHMSCSKSKFIKFKSRNCTIQNTICESIVDIFCLFNLRTFLRSFFCRISRQNFLYFFTHVTHNFSCISTIWTIGQYWKQIVHCKNNSFKFSLITEFMMFHVWCSEFFLFISDNIIEMFSFY